MTKTYAVVTYPQDGVDEEEIVSELIASIKCNKMLLVNDQKY